MAQAHASGIVEYSKLCPIKEKVEIIKSAIQMSQ
jgi:hypothetical protein